MFGDPSILYDEQHRYIGDPLISATEQVKMWGSIVNIFHIQILIELKWDTPAKVASPDSLDSFSL